MIKYFLILTFLTNFYKLSANEIDKFSQIILESIITNDTNKLTKYIISVNDFQSICNSHNIKFGESERRQIDKLDIDIKNSALKINDKLDEISNHLGQIKIFKVSYSKIIDNQYDSIIEKFNIIITLEKGIGFYTFSNQFSKIKNKYLLIDNFKWEGEYKDTITELKSRKDFYFIINFGQILYDSRVNLLFMNSGDFCCRNFVKTKLNLSSKEIGLIREKFINGNNQYKPENSYYYANMRVYINGNEYRKMINESINKELYDLIIKSIESKKEFQQLKKYAKFTLPIYVDLK